ncbi:hypothetical protein Taro_029092 [Colocasia esculenta]|uniref:Alliinase C-terminal domain-containing protein n=1 Tax=Colocasia esculenta TaxID=4460 RepID=A0A843VIZ0_COLES|nr:hypothetical protein [Colocasia esculenta]
MNIQVHPGWKGSSIMAGAFWQTDGSVSGRLSRQPAASVYLNFHQHTINSQGTCPSCILEDVEDCEQFLRRLNIITRSGKNSGSGLRYVRVSMLDTDEKFDLFVKRILAILKDIKR